MAKASAGRWMLALALIGGALALRRKRPAPCPVLADGELAGVQYLTEAGRDPAAAPTIIFHGRGAGPEAMRQITSGLAPGAQIWPAGLEPKGSGRVWIQARSVDSDFDSQLRANLPAVAAFVAEVARCYGKPVVAGHSQGAIIAYALASEYPQIIKEAIGASGTLPESFWDRPFAVPVQVLHGTDDATVPFGRTQSMAAAKGAQLWPMAGGTHSFSGEMRSIFNDLVAGH